MRNRIDDILEFNTNLYIILFEGNLNALGGSLEEGSYINIYRKIKRFRLDDFRLHFYKAAGLYYESIATNNRKTLEKARQDIELSMFFLQSVKKEKIKNDTDYETMLNNENLYCSNYNGRPPFIFNEDTNRRDFKKEVKKIYMLAGEIYAVLGDAEASLRYYMDKIEREISNQEIPQELDGDYITLYSFRRYNEHSLADLINNKLTVCHSSEMNDPLDSILNLWATEENFNAICEEKKHIQPYIKSYDYLRIRSFVAATNGVKEKNILNNIPMWSHYTDSHKGYCIKYRLSKEFLKEQNRCIIIIKYLKPGEGDKYDKDDRRIDIRWKPLNILLAAKEEAWIYENEARLIVYDRTKEDHFYGVPLDNNSKIESIYFGLRCPERDQNTIKNIFKNDREISFYKITGKNKEDVYDLTPEEIIRE